MDINNNNYNEGHLRKKSITFLLYLTIAALGYKLIIGLLPIWNINFNSYGYSEWLINYEGGFIRRGLIGSILPVIEGSKLTSINLLVLFTNSILLGILCYGVYKRNTTLNKVLLIICILGPFGLLNHYFIGEFFFRKEVFNLVILFLIYFITCEKKFLSKGLKILLIVPLSIFGILNHESFFFAHFILLGWLFFSVFSTRLSVILISTILISAIITLIVPGDLKKVNAIWESQSLHDRTVLSNPMAMETISWPIKTGIQAVFDRPLKFPNNMVWSICFLILVILTIVTMVYLKKRPKSFIYIIILNLGVLPLFFIGIDWGRWINLIWLNFIFYLILEWKLKPIEFIEGISHPILRRVGKYYNKISVSDFMFLLLFIFSSIIIIPESSFGHQYIILIKNWIN